MLTRGIILEIKPIYQVLTDSVNKNPDKTAVMYKPKSDSRYQSILYSELLNLVNQFASALLFSGINKDSKVAIMSDNRYEWVVSDLAILSIGAVTVPIYPTLHSSTVEYMLKNSDTQIIILSNKEQLFKVLDVRARLHKLQKIIIMENDLSLIDGKDIVLFQNFIEIGKNQLSNQEFLLRLKTLQNAISPDDLASIIYTSGTTGEPKGAMITHRNFISNVISATANVPMSPEDTFLSFIPLSHVFERTAGFYAPIYYGSTIAYTFNNFTIAENIREIKPTIMVSVPRLYETFFERIQNKSRKEKSVIRKALFKFCINTAIKIGEIKNERKNLFPLLTLQQTTAEYFLFKKIRALFGGNIKYFISGGASLSKMISYFFNGVGVLILEGYGLTESSPVICVNRPYNNKIGTVGQAIEGIELKITSDGEICCRGHNVMKGYWKLPFETSQTIDSEGWLHTGDMGHIDEEGFLTITDRLKNIIVLSNGKNIAPQPIEQKLCHSPYISDCVLIGDDQKVIGALIIPQKEYLTDFAKFNNIEFTSFDELVIHPRIKLLYKDEIDRLTVDLADYEKVRTFKILDIEFTQENQALTPSLKKRRHVIKETYKDIIASMYSKI